MKKRLAVCVLALLLAGIACGPFGTTPTETLAPPTATSIPEPHDIDPHSDWLTYANSDCAYEIRIPPGSTITLGSDSDRIDLPFAEGTNLHEKYIEVTCLPAATGCSSMYGEGSREFNGTMFSFYEGADAGAGNFWNWITYTTIAGTMCTDLSFTLHSVNAMNYTPPIPEYDQAAESAVFDEIMDTFTWVGP
jgi:hypothetical protein